MVSSRKSVTSAARIVWAGTGVIVTIRFGFMQGLFPARIKPHPPLKNKLNANPSIPLRLNLENSLSHS